MYVTTRLGRWFYEEHGESRRPGDPTIVLLHGLLFDGAVWDEQVRPLSELGRVVVIDGPGHGRSEVPPPFSLDDHARALVDALDALGIFKSMLVGLSWGGRVAMRVALDNPMRVVALALIGTSASPEGLGRRAKFRIFNSVARSFGLSSAQARQRLAPGVFGATTIAERPELIDAWYGSLMGYSRLGVSRAVKAVVLHRAGIVDKLRAVGCPTLVVAGNEDRALPVAHSRAIASRIPRATLVEIEGAGPSSPLEQPERVNEALLPFVRDQLDRPA